MFYEVHVLARKGALATIWIAAHIDKRLKRQQITETDIHQSVDLIMKSEAPFALRLSSQLLFGIVRVYHRKMAYLLQDCNDAFSKLQNAFVRTTLSATDFQSAYENLALPEDIFNVNQMESWYLDSKNLSQNELAMFAESFAALPEMNNALVLMENPFEDDRELPPLNDIIPEDEITRDVMREMSQETDVRLSDLGAAETVRQSSRGGDLVARISSFSREPVSEAPLELNQSPLVNQSSPLRSLSPQQSPKLPDITPGLHTSTTHDVMLESIESPLVSGKVLRNDTGKAKNHQRKCKAVVDNKATVMTNVEYKRMHKRRSRTIHKKTNLLQLLESNAQKKAISLSQCCACHLHNAKMLQEVWEKCIEKNEGTNSVHQESEREFGGDVLRSKRKEIDFFEIEAPLFPCGADSGLSDGLPLRSPLRESCVNELVEFPAVENINEDLAELRLNLNQEPAGEEDDQNIFIRRSQKPKESHSQSFSSRSRSVLSHVRNAISMENDSDNETLCTSPKRRKLSTPVPSDGKRSIFLQDVIKAKSRLEASQWFYELLVLKANGLVELKQPEAYEDISITLPEI